MSRFAEYVQPAPVISATPPMTTDAPPLTEYIHRQPIAEYVQPVPVTSNDRLRSSSDRIRSASAALGVRSAITSDPDRSFSDRIF